MTKFIKPNNDRIFYLFSDKATKNNVGTKTYEYRWDIPDVTLDDWGKLYYINRAYKSLDVTTTPIVTRIMNLGSKDIIDTFGGAGQILDISSWNYQIGFNTDNNPPISICPQTINNITLCISDDMTNCYAGFTTTNVFCIVLKLTEGDQDMVEFGSTNNVNINQRTIPNY